jgi:2-polyprenyl-3-methyl-5-hydroxy-6-metoxy-1,4-benzoquinol methylase
MDYKSILDKCRKALKKGGVLIIQDLYEEKTLSFYLLSLAGMLLNPFLMLLKNGRMHVTREEMEIWGRHKEDDHYNSIYDIRKMAVEVLKKVKIRRHIFWRYTLVYRKPE